MHTGTDVVAVISRFSAIARESDSSRAVELTASAIAEVLDADAAAADAPLCVVSAPKREKKARTPGRRRNDDVTWQDIADRLGISRKSLGRYRSGVNPWPAGMQEQFEGLTKCRAASDPATLPDAPTKPRRTRVDGELSWANIARDLDMHPKMLRLCREGKRPWPTGVQERFEQMTRQRSANCRS